MWQPLDFHIATGFVSFCGFSHSECFGKGSLAPSLSREKLIFLLSCMFVGGKKSLNLYVFVSNQPKIKIFVFCGSNQKSYFIYFATRMRKKRTRRKPTTHTIHESIQPVSCVSCAQRSYGSMFLHTHTKPDTPYSRTLLTNVVWVITSNADNSTYSRRRFCMFIQSIFGCRHFFLLLLSVYSTHFYICSHVVCVHTAYDSQVWCCFVETNSLAFFATTFRTFDSDDKFSRALINVYFFRIFFDLPILKVPN